MEALSRLAKATFGTTYENQLWLVGGAVRDQLLGLPVGSDFDIVLESSALELAQFLRERGVAEIEPVVYPRFGTALIRIAGSDVELATARQESYDETSRKPDVRPATLVEDAKRRDFTINTLLRNIHTGELWDPLNLAMKDLQNKVLRTPLDPAATFRDDPLRMLRAVRFRWKLHLTPDSKLYEAVRNEAERLAIISAERIRDEIMKMLALPDADKCLADLVELGLADHFAPEFRAMVGVEQGSYHHLDVWNHTLLVLRNAGHNDLILALAALLHDVAKPQTRFIDADGAIRFFGHEAAGAEETREILRRLKFSNETIDPVALLVKNHMRLGSAPKFTDAAARRLIRDMGDQLDRLLLLCEADAAGLKKGVRHLDLEPIRETLKRVQAATTAKQLESPLTGEEIMHAAGLEPGPQVGRIKAALTELVLEGDLAPGDKDGALERLPEIVQAAADNRPPTTDNRKPTTDKPSY